MSFFLGVISRFRPLLLAHVALVANYTHIDLKGRVRAALWRQRCLMQVGVSDMGGKRRPPHGAAHSTGIGHWAADVYRPCPYGCGDAAPPV